MPFTGVLGWVAVAEVWGVAGVAGRRAGLADWGGAGRVWACSDKAGSAINNQKLKKRRSGIQGPKVLRVAPANAHLCGVVPGRRSARFFYAMKIHLFGASGAGVTTLGGALSQQLGVPYFDTDTYFWLPTEPPFTQRRPAAARAALLARDLARHPGWLLGGSLVGWDEEWLTAFDLAVFLWLPPALRLARLQQREETRYGDAIRADPARAAQSRAFLAWAAGYEDNTSGGSRTLANHTDWLNRFTCPVLVLRGDFTVAERAARVKAKLRELGYFIK